MSEIDPTGKQPPITPKHTIPTTPPSTRNAGAKKKDSKPGAFFKQYGFTEKDCKTFMDSLTRGIESQIDRDRKKAKENAQKIKRMIEGTD